MSNGSKKNFGNCWHSPASSANNSFGDNSTMQYECQDMGRLHAIKIL